MHMVSALLYSFLVIIMFHSALLGTYLMSCRNSRSLILLFSILTCTCFPSYIFMLWFSILHLYVFHLTLVWFSIIYVYGFFLYLYGFLSILHFLHLYGFLAFISSQIFIWLSFLHTCCFHIWFSILVVVFYAPNFEKVGRAYCFGLVRVSVFPCVRTTFLAHLSRHAPSSVRPPFSKIFFSETAWPIKAKFYMKHLWEGGTNVYVNNPVHMTKMAAMPIYGKNPSKIFFSGTTGPISTKLGIKHR